MSARVWWEGLEELKAQLAALPARLVEEATAIAITNAEAAKTDIYNAYPKRTGNLREGLSVTVAYAGPFGVDVVLRNSRRDARWFEKGTQTRQTKLGANRGAMPAGNIFWPRFYRWRRHMWDDWAAMLEREGLTVTGTPDA
jgi:hypothetical protein